MSHRLLCLATAFLFLPALSSAAEPAAGRQKLYVTNSTGDDVTIVDVATNKPIGRIEVGPHPHGIAVPAAQDVVYVTIEGSTPGELVAIDPAMDKVIRRMPVGPAPNQLAVTPDGKYACVPVGDGHFAIVDLAKFEIIARYFTGGEPHNTLCSPDGKRFYLAPKGDPNKVTVLEVGTWKAVAEIPFSDAVRPIALSQDEKRLYACVDGLVGMEVADVPAHKMIHRIADELTDEEKKVPSRSHGLAVRPDQQEVWECDVAHHEVHVYDVSADEPRQVATVPIGSEVYWLTFRPDGKVCYVSARGGGQVVAVDADTKKVVARIPVGKEPKRLLVVTLPEGPKK